jgi:hypothetical protein
MVDGHARWYEQASRGQIFSAMTALAGTTIAAGNVKPPAAGAATVLSILNPIGSGVNLEILQGWVFFFSASPPGGAWSWCTAQTGVSITAAEAVALKGACLIGQRVTKAMAWSQTALTGSTVHVQARLFPITGTNDPVQEGTAGIVGVDNVDGAITVPPGVLLTLAPPGPGVNSVVGAGILYAEVPLPG